LRHNSFTQDEQQVYDQCVFQHTISGMLELLITPYRFDA
jgi:hypothetical protein